MRITPLTGQVLIEILPPDKLSAGGIEIPEYTMTPEDHQAAARSPEKPPAIIGLVRKTGDWPKLKNGFLKMPEFGVGAKVAISPHAGIEFHYDVKGRFKMVKHSDVLAVLG